MRAVLGAAVLARALGARAGAGAGPAASLGGGQRHAGALLRAYGTRRGLGGAYHRAFFPAGQPGAMSAGELGRRVSEVLALHKRDPGYVEDFAGQLGGVEERLVLIQALRQANLEVLTEVEQSFLEADLDSNGSIDQEEFGR